MSNNGTVVAVWVKNCTINTYNVCIYILVIFKLSNNLQFHLYCWYVPKLLLLLHFEHDVLVHPRNTVNLGALKVPLKTPQTPDTTRTKPPPFC